MIKNKKIFEITVDRTNDKWPFIFEQILCVLHNIIDSRHRFLYFFWFLKYPKFSFEIVNQSWITKFFIISEEKYVELLKSQIYAHFPNVEVSEVEDFFSEKYKNWYYASLNLKSNYFNPIRIYHDFWDRTERGVIDPFSALTSALNKTSWSGLEIIQVNFSPMFDYEWKWKNSVFIQKQKYPEFLKKFLLSRNVKIIRKIFNPLVSLIRIIFDYQDNSEDKDELLELKLDSYWYSVSINIGCYSEKIDEYIAKKSIKDIYTSLNIFSLPSINSFVLSSIKKDENQFLAQRKNNKDMILNTKELSWFVHLPTLYVKTPHINWITYKTLEHPVNLPLLNEQHTVAPIGITNWRWMNEGFWLYESDRQRHVYIIWKTWMGKSTLLENMIFDDILNWRWVWLIDPHWDLAETILANIPKSRTNDVVIFDPADKDFPVAFNILWTVPKDMRPLISSWLIWVFKRIFWDSWGPRLEHILRNSILTLLEVGNTTIINIVHLLTNKNYRREVLVHVKDPALVKFWQDEFETMQPKQVVEAISPILNKVWQFLSSPLLRNILGQPKNSFSLREIMDNKKIFIANLSKWKIWEDSLWLLGSMLITKFQIDAMSRANIPESERNNFYLYVDEFQNFATDSFTTILSEARKYKLNLIIANQYISQMTEEIKSAVFWNVWTTISFQVWHEDAPSLAKAFSDWSKEEILQEVDLMNVKKYNIYTKLLIEGMPSKVFSAKIFPPIRMHAGDFARQDEEKIRARSREVYAKPVSYVEEKINALYSKLTIKPKDTENEDKKSIKKDFKKSEQNQEQKEMNKSGDWQPFDKNNQNSPKNNFKKNWSYKPWFNKK